MDGPVTAVAREVGQIAGELLNAAMRGWKRWDERPGEYGAAAAMEAACAELAAELGVTTTELRERLTAGRRAGLTHKAVLTALRERGV